MDTLRHWLLPGSFLLCLSLFAGPAKATGFIDLDSGWTGTACTEEILTNCYENAKAGSVDIVGPNAYNTTTNYSYTSNGSYTIRFRYTYNPVYADYQSAFFSIGSQTYTLDPTGAFTSDIQEYNVANGDSLVFGVTNNESTSEVSILSVSNFEAVPAPLPVFGAAAAFGAIRRRRAALRKVVASQAVSNRN